MFAIPDVVISFTKVEFAKQDGAFGIFNDGVNTGEWHHVFDHVFIDSLIVKERLECPILLSVVKDWDTIRGACFVDESFCQLFCNILALKFLFSTREGICVTAKTATQLSDSVSYLMHK